MKKELTLKEKEKKFKRLARKSKFYDGVWGFRMLYPFVFALGVWGLAFIGISLLIPAILSGFAILDLGLCFFDKGLVNFLTNKALNKAEDQYYALGEELAYFIKGEDGNYYDRNYLQANRKDPKYAALLQELVQKQTFKDPKQELIYEIEKSKKPEPKLGYVFNAKSKTAFEIEEIHEAKEPINEKDIYGKDM